MQIEEDAYITGFVVDAPRGGPVCPFRLLGGLRGGESPLSPEGDKSDNRNYPWWIRVDGE